MKGKQIVGSFEVGTGWLQQRTHYRPGHFWKGQNRQASPDGGERKAIVMKVAIKIFEKDRLDKASELKRIEKEVRILKEMKHPSIIQIY